MNVYNEPKIADAFNDFLTNIGQKQAIQIPKSFETYINKVNVIIDSMPLSINELKDTFSLLKVNKADLLTILVSILLRNALGRFTNLY